MFAFSLAFLCGVLLLQTFAVLPSIFFIFLLLPATILASQIKYARLLFPLALGFTWALLYAHSILSWTLPKSWEGPPLSITGSIASIPNIGTHQTSFLFKTDTMRNRPIKTLVRLNWYNCAERLKVGDYWQLHVRLKRIHGMRNPGGFDYEAQTMQQGLRASGAVLPHVQQKLLHSHWYHYPVDRIRQKTKENLERNLQKTPTAHWLIALAVGERNNIPSTQWEVLRNTGTNHLMAIAGLHIGLMSGFAAAWVIWLWKRTPKLMLYLPATHAGAYAALFMAIFYSAMAGFSIPTQRAVLMMMIFLLVLLQRRNIPPWQAWSLALLIVLLINPLSVLSDSFWLSFGTIALIIYGMRHRIAPKGWWWKWGRTQWVIGVGLIPLSLLLFQQCSLISFVANSIAIPWLGFLILPFCFFGSLLLFLVPTVGQCILWCADKSLGMLWQILTWLSALPLSTWHHAVSPSVFISSVVAMILLLAPSAFHLRLFGFLGLLPLFFSPTKTISFGDASLSILDIGQGLSIVVQVQNHVLVYDTGAKMGSNWDMGESVVVPFLYAENIKKIDKLVISHGDNDHSGGAPAIARSFPISEIKTSVPEKFVSTHIQYCLAGESWVWDGVRFSFIYPSREHLHLGNDSSCVLRIETQSHTILLTGDIEKFAEEYLVDTSPELLAADILIAPHHGSKTSALDKFVAAIHPRYVIYSVGYKNRFHFPHPSVIHVYQHLNTIQLDTATLGMIHFEIKKDPLVAPEFYRIKHLRYWHDHM